MKKLLVAGIAVAAFCAAPALAADMPVRMPVKAAPVAVPTYNWAGFYWGVGGGGERFDPHGTVFGTTEFLNTFSRPLTGKGTTGFGEIFAGYNVVSGNILTGAEILGKFGDAKATTVINDLTITNGPPSTPQSVAEKFTWSVVPSVRGGVLVTPTVLVYGRAGWAFTGVKATIFDNAINQFTDLSGGAFGVGISRTKVINGPQVGVGTEFVVMGNLRAALEADYTWYSRLSVTGVDAADGTSFVTISSRPRELSGQARLIWAY
jgi:outer membrane immunogenic protein